MTEEASTQNVVITAGTENLYGELTTLKHPQGLVILAHNGRGNRKSIPHRYVSQILNEHNLSTLLVDPQTVEHNIEESDNLHYLADIKVISDHLGHTIRWAEKEPLTAFLNIGVFGIGAGATAAMIAAARHHEAVMAVVAQGGRPDLADKSVEEIVAPTLLICGSMESKILSSNKKAMTVLNDLSAIRIIDGADGLLENPAFLEKATSMTALWFEDNLE